VNRALLLAATAVLLVALVLTSWHVGRGRLQDQSNPTSPAIADNAAGQDGEMATALMATAIHEWMGGTPEEWATPKVTRTPIRVTVEAPWWYPERPEDIDEPEEIAEYTRHLVGDDLPWVEWYAKVTTTEDVDNMTVAGFASATAVLGSTPEAHTVVWIVGFRTSKPFRGSRLEELVGAPYSDDAWRVEPGYHYEAFVLLDRHANVRGFRVGDGISHDGTPVPNPDGWSIDDISSLREVAWP